MKKNIVATLSLTTSFLVAASGPIFAMQPDFSILVGEQGPGNARTEIREIMAALGQAAENPSNPHKEEAAAALRKCINQPTARAAKNEYNMKVFAHRHMQKHTNEEIKKQTEDLQREKEELQRKLEETEKKVQEGMNPEKMKILANQLLGGAKGYTDLLFLYPFMIGTPENDALVEEGLEKTRKEIENVEAQNKAYQEDRKKPSFSILLKMPEIDAAVDSSPLLKDLAQLIQDVARDMAAFKVVVKAQKADKTIAPLYIDLFESESTPTPTGRSYRYLERMLSEFMAIFSGHGPFDPLRVNKVFNKYKADIPLLCKYIAGIEITPSELSKAQTKMLSNIQKSPLIKAQAEQLLRAVQLLSQVLNKLQPGSKFKVTEATLNALAANELMRRLQGKTPEQFHEELVRNEEFFKQTNEEVGLEGKVINDFKKNADSKFGLLGEMWFTKNFKQDPLYTTVDKLRLAGATTDSKEKARYAEKTNIDKIVQEKITQIIDGILVKYEGNLQDPALKPEAQLAVADNFEADFAAVVDDLIDRKIKDILKKEQDNPTLKIAQAIYNAQYAHAQLILKLQKLHQVVGNKLDKVDAAHGPVEARALELRTLCQQFESTLNYIILDGDQRATHYVLVLGALASPQAWHKLGVDLVDSQAIIEAIKETRGAYFAAAEAISKIEELVPVTKTRAPHFWPGFDMHAKPLVLFDPSHGAGHAGGAQAHLQPPPMLPPVLPPPQQVGGVRGGGLRGGPARGGPPQQAAVTPAQLMVKIKAKYNATTPKVFDDARVAFLAEVRDNWKKLDYAPTLDRFLEILRQLHNAAPGATQYHDLKTFKAYLES